MVVGGVGVQDSLLRGYSCVCSSGNKGLVMMRRQAEVATGSDPA